ncbi:MAG: arylamine N-acetyltransferase, partial [Pleurocapsa sp. SU_196_0]|nr:arylamine N-acetyltransferase [Pleurocapsa sp. SU_196_0]
MTFLSSGVLRPGGMTPDGDHLILRVRLEDGDYLADAGFGDGAIHALPIREGRYRASFLEFGMERGHAFQQRDQRCTRGERRKIGVDHLAGEAVEERG